MASLLLLTGCRRHGEAVPAFSISYPQAATPGERVTFTPHRAARTVSRIFLANRPLPPDGNSGFQGRIPGDFPVATNAAVEAELDDGSRHPLPAIAVVPEAGNFGREPMTVEGDSPRRGASPARPVLMPFALSRKAGSRFQVDGFAAAHGGDYLWKSWSASNLFFVRRLSEANGRTTYSDPKWFRPLLGKEETFADYRIDARRGVLADRWSRRADVDAGGAATVEAGLPVLKLPSKSPIRFGIADLPSGPMTVSLWLCPLHSPAGHGGQVIRSSFMLTVGIDRSGHYYARRPDEARHPQVATSPQPVSTGRWQHLAAVYDGRNVSVFVDGKRSGSVPCTGLVASWGTRAETLGEAIDRSHPFHGTIGAYAVYNRALTDGEVAAVASCYANISPGS